MKHTTIIRIRTTGRSIYRQWGCYKNNKFYVHRENNLPATEYSDGNKFYWKHYLFI